MIPIAMPLSQLTAAREVLTILREPIKAKNRWAIPSSARSAHGLVMRAIDQLTAELTPSEDRS